MTLLLYDLVDRPWRPFDGSAEWFRRAEEMLQPAPQGQVVDQKEKGEPKDSADDSADPGAVVGGSTSAAA